MTRPTVQPAAKLFQTFCHINEYEEDGFANLHRMIATSEPLVLWGPSSQYLQSPRCRVDPGDFIRLVEAGRVRIVARREWLTSKATRDGLKLQWAGARWDDRVDDAISRIAAEDERSPNDEKRVLIAPDEGGTRYAADYVAEHADHTRRLYDEMASADARNLLPKGLRGALREQADDPAAVVRRLLRDVFNHGEAIHLAGTEAPFFLAPRESAFLRLLDESLRVGVSVPDASLGFGRPDGLYGAEPPASALSTDDYAELTREVFGILETLDRQRRTSLQGFVAGDGHTSLTRWYRESCASLHERLPESRAGVLVRDLQARYEAGAFDDETLRKSFLTSIDGMLGTAGLTASVADWVSQGTIGTWGLAGLAAGAVGAGRGALRGLGYTKVGPKKPEWPFLYTFGGAPNRRRFEKIARALDRLRA